MSSLFKIFFTGFVVSLVDVFYYNRINIKVNRKNKNILKNFYGKVCQWNIKNKKGLIKAPFNPLTLKYHIKSNELY